MVIRYWIFAGTVLATKVLSFGTVPSNKVLFAGTVKYYPLSCMRIVYNFAKFYSKIMFKNYTKKY